jgi:hypothetical protein
VTDHVLTPHRSGAAQAAVRGVTARVELASAGTLRFEYRLSGELAQVAIPARVASQRAERLWEHTCFEAFVAPGVGPRYYELNFSPSSEWAAYEFDGYRQAMRPLALAGAPQIAIAETACELRVTASAAIVGLAGAAWPWRVGLTAVIEDRAGGRAYFALRHPRDNPDFHDAAGFAVSLDGSAR